MLYNRFRFQRRATTAITREKARSDELPRDILPAEVAEELKDTGKTTARHFDLVTVLFSDVADFPQLSEKLSPQYLVATLDTYFGAFDAITGRFGLEKIKTIGDAYMLAGGLGQGTAADPALVVRAALTLLAAVEQPRAEREPRGLPYFAIRIGRHTGPVVAGVVGGEEARLRHLGRHREHRRPPRSGRGAGAGQHLGGHARAGGQLVCLHPPRQAGRQAQGRYRHVLRGRRARPGPLTPARCPRAVPAASRWAYSRHPYAHSKP